MFIDNDNILSCHVLRLGGGECWLKAILTLITFAEFVLSNDVCYGCEFANL